MELKLKYTMKREEGTVVSPETMQPAHYVAQVAMFDLSPVDHGLLVCLLADIAEELGHRTDRSPDVVLAFAANSYLRSLAAGRAATN